MAWILLSDLYRRNWWPKPSTNATYLSIGQGIRKAPDAPRRVLELSHQTVAYLWRDSMSYIISYSKSGYHPLST